MHHQPTPSTQHTVVSFDDEPLILVNENDHIIGYRDKLSCHLGQGLLHRAFSVFLFNTKGELLLQERSAQKMLWPNTWSNSCCSHPRRGETMQAAAARRTQQELGCSVELTYLYQFIYQAPYTTIGAEHELCSVFIGRSDGPIHTNHNEIARTCWLSPSALDAALAGQHDEFVADAFTPWLIIEWRTLRQQHWPAVTALARR